MGENWRRFLPPKRVRFGMMCAVLILVVLFAPGFLAVSNPVGKGVLVVEAWIPKEALADSLNVFNSGHYSYFVVVGGPIQRTASNSHYPPTYDDLATQRLAKLGFDTAQLVKISVPPVLEGRRTIATATAVKDWLSNSRIATCCVEVFTVGVHARKSWIIFRHVLRDHYRVGIIAGPEAAYDPRFWFFSTRGIWYVVRNLAGCMYAEIVYLT